MTQFTVTNITSGPVAQPGCDLSFPYLSGGADFSVAIAAVNRLVTARLEGDFGAFATLGTCCGEHLASGSVAAAAVSETFRLS